MSENKNFDFTGFTSAVLNIVDSIRSNGKDGSKNPTESRINALYRAIGLPAVSINKNAKIKTERTNNGNFFDELSISNENEQMLIDRKGSFTIKVTEDEIRSFFDDNQYSLTDCINKRRARGNLFPMVVDGDIEIFPKSKRVGQAFSTNEELREDKIKYHRPLIESILVLKLSENGMRSFNGDVRQAISKEIFNLFKDIQSGLTESSNSISGVMTVAVQTINKIRSKIGNDVVSVSDSVPEQNPEVISDEEKLGELEKQKKRQTLELIRKQARLAIFDFDDSFGSGDATNRNLKSTLLISPILDIVAGSSGTIDKSISETTKKISKANEELKNAYKELDSILGVYSGLSGTDVLAIIMSLFKLDISVLYSLLNDDSKIKMQKKWGLEENSIPSVSAESAIAELSRNVESTLKELDIAVKVTETREQITRKKKVK